MEVGLVSDMIHVLVRHHYGLEREQEDELAYVVVGLDMDSWLHPEVLEMVHLLQATMDHERHV